MKKITLTSSIFFLLLSCTGDSDNPDEVILSGQKEVISFTIDYQGTTYEATVHNDSIIAHVPSAVDLTNLAPEITISEKASVSPASGMQQDFTDEVLYTVSAEDKSTKTYKASITKINSANEILSFRFKNLADGPADFHWIDNNPMDLDTIAYRVPYLSPIKALESEIDISEDAMIEPASGEILDYSKPVEYKVTAEGGSVKNYLVTVDNTLDPVTINEFTSDRYTGMGPGEIVSFNANVLNPIRDSIQVKLLSSDGLNEIQLDIQNVDYNTNEVSVVLPDSYKNDNYVFQLAIENDNMDLSDGFLLNHGDPNFNGVSDTDQGNVYQTLLMPGEKFWSNLFIDASRFADHSFFLRQNGQDYEFADVVFDPVMNQAEFTMPQLTNPLPIDGFDFEMVIKLDGREYAYPLLNAQKNPIQIVIGKQFVFSSIDTDHDYKR